MLGGGGSHLEASGGRKMGLKILSQAVEAGSRKLQAGWTIEAMQDLNSQHGLDVESEMTKALSAEIVQGNRLGNHPRPVGTGWYRSYLRF